MNIPRPEHPNPQWERNNWRNLNGIWQFEIDNSNSAYDKKYHEKTETLAQTIIVPFCPESTLSGVGYTDFINAVCYKKSITLTRSELSGRVILHFGAVDYETNLYVNGKFAGKHIGGYTSFEFDITDFVTEGENTLFLYVKDDVRNPEQPVGKQSRNFYSYGCHYTRTTGIWQTVWLEFVPTSHIKKAKFYPDAYNSSLIVMGETTGKGEISAKAFFEGKEVGTKTVKTDGYFNFTLELSETHLWQPGDGKLYDLELSFGSDVVKSYFGLRSIGLDGCKFLINGKSVFQRLILDQGFYPDGIYTARDDETLEHDIILSMNAGFNGARLHEKVFEARFLYYCDKHGYLVWGEYANWGFACSQQRAVELYTNQWLEAIERDFNHPSIIGWCPFNETWDHIEQKQRVKCLETVYNITKAADPTRPCIDTSGNYHTKTDIYDVHDYDQIPETFRARYKIFDETGDFDYTDKDPYAHHPGAPFFGEYYKYKVGTPAFVSEYGGIAWDKKEGGWGYGNMPKTEEEFFERYKGLTDVLLDNKNMFGFCYTQLTDVEQEQNGIYQYDRTPKFDIEKFRVINSRKAAIED